MSENINNQLDKLQKELQNSANEDAEITYSKKVIEYSLNPINVGRMNAPDGSAHITGICGDSMEIYLEIEDKTIVKALFFSNGCGVTFACGSAVTKLVNGRHIQHALDISPGDIIDELDELPDENIHCAILATSTLHKAIAEYFRMQI